MPRRISSASSRAAAAHRDQCVKSIPDCPGGANCPHGKGMFTRSFSTRISEVIEEDERDLLTIQEEEDRKVIQELYDSIKKSKTHSENYLALIGFLMLLILYIVILYLQAESGKTFEVSTAHYGLLPDGLTGTGDFSFSSVDDVYSWIDEKIVEQIWYDAVCGNSICERPDEYQAFGRFGCSSDCGNNPNVSTIMISLTTAFSSEEEMAASSWNLCLKDPYPLCWFEENENFTKLVGVNSTVMEVPDGNWTLTLDAPYGHVSGTVTYNDTYAWKSPNPFRNGDVVVHWEACAPDQSKTATGICREVSVNISTCLKGCSLDGFLLGNGAIPDLFIDFIDLCDADPYVLDQFQGLACQEVKEQIITNSSDPAFELIYCDGISPWVEAPSPAPSPASLFGPAPSPLASPVGRRLLQVEEAKKRMALAELGGDPYLFTDTIWNNIGSTDGQRLFNLQVSTQRALYSWVNNECLVKHPKPLNSTLRLSAFLCTFFGGPITLNGCAYANSTGTNLTRDVELAYEMKKLHANLNISTRQQEEFVSVFILALKSITRIDDVTVTTIIARMRSLDTEIANPSSVGCPFVSQTLPWSLGISYTVAISKGDIVTWTWSDDEPHSLQLDDGLGQDPNTPFKGFGTNRLVVSRNSLCSPYNVGIFNPNKDPAPCILAEVNATGQTFFKVSFQFNSVENFTFVDGRAPGTTYGFLYVTETLNESGSTNSSSFQCSPGCSLNLLRNGQCNPTCNNADCAFDGGDCSCPTDVNGVPSCTCPVGQTKGKDGVCCESFGVGYGLEFPFTILKWSPNATESDANFLPKNGPPQFRFISEKNRVLIGMSIYQERWASEVCKSKRFFFIYPNCSTGASTKKYGVNPVFLPTSDLYNPDFAANDTLYYGNYSLGFDNDTLRNSKGFPFGFEPQSLGTPPTFHYLFDLNFNHKQAKDSLQYMQDGFFIDNATKSLTVELITYNGIAQFFTSFQVGLTFELGGRITAFYDIQAINVLPYRTADDKFRAVLEIIFLAAILWNIIEEAREYWQTKRETGSYVAHFTSLWNIVDLISLGILLASIALWLKFYNDNLKPFDIDVRYEIYDLTALRAPGQFWDIVPPGKGFQDALSAFRQVKDMAQFRNYYFALNSINVLLMMLRLLKLMDFQPRMGTITRTVSAAAPDLLHFFIVFFLTFFGFALFGFVAFGHLLVEFRSIPVALVTCFSAILGNDSVNDSLVQLRGWQLIAGVLFWWSFILIVLFVIFNLLIAIIVEGFIKVRATYKGAPSMPEEVFFLIATRIKRLFGPFKTDRKLLRELRALGAVKEQYNLVISEKTMSYGPEVIVIGGKEVDLETLKAILQRNARAQDTKEVKRWRKGVNPDLVAEVLFKLFGQSAQIVEHDDEDDLTKSAIDKLEVTRTVMDSLKVQLESLKREINSL